MVFLILKYRVQKNIARNMSEVQSKYTYGDTLIAFNIIIAVLTWKTADVICHIIFHVKEEFN